jgi:hypothetical protein
MGLLHLGHDMGCECMGRIYLGQVRGMRILAGFI